MRSDGPGARLDARHGAGGLAGDPERAGARRQRRGACAEPQRPARLAAAEVDPRDRTVGGRRDPDRAEAGRDGARHVAELDRLHDAVDARVDLDDAPRQAVGDPERAAAEREPGRLAAGVDRHDAVAVRVDARDGPVAVARDPDGAAARGDRARPAADGVLLGDRAAVDVDAPDRVLVDAPEPVVAGRQQRDRDRAPSSTTAAPARTTGRRDLRRGTTAASSGRPRLVRRRRGRVERRILPEDRLLEGSELRAGLDAGGLDEHPACLAVGLERVGLPARAVEREHALRVERLAERVLGDERVELGQDVAVAAGGEIGLDGELERTEAQLLEPADLGRCVPSHRGSYTCRPPRTTRPASSCPRTAGSGWLASSTRVRS